MLGYEEDIRGTGAKAFYYDNEFLIGTPLEDSESDLEFDW